MRKIVSKEDHNIHEFLSSPLQAGDSDSVRRPPLAEVVNRIATKRRPSGKWEVGPFEISNSRPSSEFGIKSQAVNRDLSHDVIILKYDNKSDITDATHSYNLRERKELNKHNYS